jgi:hypothetical protein
VNTAKNRKVNRNLYPIVEPTIGLHMVEADYIIMSKSASEV